MGTASGTASVFNAAVKQFPDRAVPVVIAIDGNLTIQGTGLKQRTGTTRHLYEGGPGQRSIAELLCKTTGWTDNNGNAATVDFESALTGVVAVVSGKAYRIMAAKVAADEQTFSLVLDAPDAVGQ